MSRFMAVVFSPPPVYLFLNQSYPIKSSLRFWGKNTGAPAKSTGENGQMKNVGF